MADGGVALNSNCKGEVNAPGEAHLGQREKDWHLMLYELKDIKIRTSVIFIFAVMNIMVLLDGLCIKVDSTIYIHIIEVRELKTLL